MKTTQTAVSIIIASLIVSGAIFLSSSRPASQAVASPKANNVTTENGKQIITITSKGGYLPKLSLAKADTATILRVKTQGTFDCSSSLKIPRLGISKNLPITGTTDIEIPPQKNGTSLDGTCSMGMYSFRINFKS
jgi:plastocyanin domain-containing protein